ncbi:ThiF family adenylyltransferase [Agromyces terreus]|uniref:ThiF family adenylyltransferase n=1 Tax=Agromyces terreus TaxID=424795 RepID=UPI0031CF617D
MDPVSPALTRPGPLVQPGPPLTGAQVSRFSRQLMLPGFGELAQRRLAAARVLVIGAGGLGSALVPYLAGSGVGTIGLADDDTVELSNLHRQVSHGVADLGRAKVDSLADTVAAIDPSCRVIRHRDRLTSANLLDLLADYDLLVDGSDNFPTRYLANDAAVLAGIPLVWGSILRFHGQAGVSWREFGPTYRDLFPVPPSPDEVLSCEQGGVLPSICALVGALMSTEVVKIVTGVGEPLLGRVITVDTLTGRSREIAYEAVADAPEITSLIDYEVFCGVRAPGDAGDDAAADGAVDGEGAGADAASARASGTPAPRGVTAAEVLARVRGGEALRLLDVREPHEASLRRIAGSELLPLGDLVAGAEPESGDAPLIVYCEQDLRSRRAARVLLERGHADVVFLVGGIDRFASVADDLVQR